MTYATTWGFPQNSWKFKLGYLHHIIISIKTQHEMVQLETGTWEWLDNIGYWDDPVDQQKLSLVPSRELHSQVKPPPHHNWNEAAWRKWRELVKPLVKDGKGYIYIYVVYGLTSYNFRELGKDWWRPVKGLIVILKKTCIDWCVCVCSVCRIKINI